MRISKFLILALLIVTLCAGCKGEKKTETSALDLEKQPEVLIFDKEKIDPAPVGADRPRTMSVVLHPNIAGTPKTEEVLAMSDGTPDDSNITVKVLSKYISGNNYVLIYSITNNDTKGRNILCNQTSYDQLGRVVNSSTTNRYLASKEQFIERLTFAKTGSENRWVIKASYRR